MKTIKISLFLLLSSFSLKAQIKFIPDNISKDSSINTLRNIPIKGASKKVDVFMLGEKPKEEFYKVRILESSGSADANFLLNQLKQNAATLGFDAIQILGTNNYNNVGYSTTSAITQGVINGITRTRNYQYYPVVTTGQTISAIAIKYKKNMDYVANNFKEATIQFNNQDKQVFHLKYSLTNYLLAENDINQTIFFLQNISLFQYADVIVNNSQYYYDSNGLTNYTSNAQFINGKLITDSSAVKYKFAFNDDKTINYVNIKVTALLHNRVQYTEAIKYYLDITPAEEIERIQFQAASFHTGKRPSKIGRPTKKERRDLDEFMEG